LLGVHKNHGEIEALAFDPLKDGPKGRRTSLEDDRLINGA
jgi:hypothetical protein